MTTCIFCKIVQRKAPAKIVKETEDLLVFKDIEPKAPIHLLMIPKKHVSDITQLEDSLWIKMKEMINLLAKEKDLDGFRLVHNAGKAAIIPHMHIHFLGKVSVEREI